MTTIFKINLKKALHDHFLMFWSLIFPIVMAVFLSSVVDVKGYTTYILTAMIGISVLSYAFMTTSFNILMQRKRGVYNLLRITPLSLYKYVISVSLSWAVISVLCGFIVLIAGSIIFNLSFSFISIVALIPVIFIASSFYIFLSFFISSFCKDMSRAALVNNIILMTSIFVSGSYYSLESFPPFIRFLSKLNPFEYFVTAIRDCIYLKWKSYFIDITLLIAFFIIALILAVNTFRYSDN